MAVLRSPYHVFSCQHMKFVGLNVPLFGCSPSRCSELPEFSVQQRKKEQGWLLCKEVQLAMGGCDFLSIGIHHINEAAAVKTGAKGQLFSCLL